MKNLLIPFLCMLYLHLNAQANPFTKSWTNPDIIFNKMILTSDSSFLIIGSDSAENIVVKVSVSGDSIWSVTITDSIIISDVTENRVTSEYVFCGYTKVSINKSSVLFATDTSGNLKWQKKYSALSGGISFTKINFFSDNGFYINADQSDPTSGSAYGTALLRFRNDGEHDGSFLRNSHTHSAGEPTIFDSSKVLVPVLDDDPAPNMFQIKLWKTDTSLSTTEWVYSYMPFTNADFGRIQQCRITDDKGFVFSTVVGTWLEPVNYTCFKIDSAGQVQWVYGPDYANHYANTGLITPISGNRYILTIGLSQSTSFILDSTGNVINEISGPLVTQPHWIEINNLLYDVSSNSLISIDNNLNGCNLSTTNFDIDSSLLYPVQGGNGFPGFVPDSLIVTPFNINFSVNSDFFNTDCIYNTIDEKEISKWNIYPNPFYHDLIISSEYHESVESVEIYNSVGKSMNITVERISNNSLKVNSRYLSTGFYFLRINNTGVCSIIKTD